MIDNPDAGAVGDDILGAAVNRGDGAEHLGGGEIKAAPVGEAVVAGDAGEIEHWGHFLSERISPRGGIFIIAYWYIDTIRKIDKIFLPGLCILLCAF